MGPFQRRPAAASAPGQELVPAAPAVDGRPVCGQRAASCICLERPGHNRHPGTPHSCECGGSWHGREGFNSFEVVTWPRVPLGFPFPLTGVASLLGAMFGDDDDDGDDDEW